MQVNPNMNSMTSKPSEIGLIIADDDEITRIGLRHALEAMNRFSRIQEVGSGETLMARLEQEPVDLVLLDIGMPGMDGITATRLIKERFPHVKVLILSYHDTSEKVG